MSYEDDPERETHKDKVAAANLVKDKYLVLCNLRVIGDWFKTQDEAVAKASRWTEMPQYVGDTFTVVKVVAVNRPTRTWG